MKFEEKISYHLATLYNYKDKQAYRPQISTGEFIKANTFNELIAKLGEFRIEDLCYLDGLVHTLTNEEKQNIFTWFGGEVKIDLVELLFVVARLYKDSEKEIEYHCFEDLYAERISIKDNVINVSIGS